MSTCCYPWVQFSGYFPPKVWENIQGMPRQGIWVREQCNKLRNVKISSSIPKVIFERGDGKNYLLLLIF